MTITFVPGEVNKSPYSVLQALWKSHHIIAYGSGNNLILSTISKTSQDSSSNKDIQSNHLQTVYLESDPTAVSINSNNGLVATALNNKLFIFKPVNEYMSKPQWLEALVISNEKDNSSINCLLWAINEDELVVGSDESLTVYHIFIEYGTVNFNQRFCKLQSSPIHDIRLTPDSARIITYSTRRFNNLIKFWSRISFNDDQSLFELTYLKHPNGTWVKDAKWRNKNPNFSHNNQIDASMANIKNIRSYIGDSNNDNDILYTLTNDNVIRVWSTFEFSGRNHIRCWNELDLRNYMISGEDVSGIEIFDSSYLRSSLVPLLQNTDEGLFKCIDTTREFDLMFVTNRAGQVSIFAVTDLNGNPPNGIKFTKLGGSFKFDVNSFPLSTKISKFESISKEFIKSQEFNVNLNPVIFSQSSIFHNDDVCLLVHDRIKDTIRVNIFNFKHLIEEKDDYIGCQLMNKFQGHTKSIRKLVTSSSYSKSNILLSILNFPEHNYIWEPLLLNPKKNQSMSVTKRFQVDVRRGIASDPHQEGIWDAILINDIRPSLNNRRRHLVITSERGGYLSFWSCNGIKHDDEAAQLVQRVAMLNDTGDHIHEEPKSLLLINSHEDEYCAISIFNEKLIKAWKFNVSDDDDDIKIDIQDLRENVEPLAHISSIHKISTIDSFTSNNLVSIIDEKGTLRILSTHFDNSKVYWKELKKIHTNISNASKIHGSSIIKRFAIVDDKGSKLTIWDTKSGILEYEEELPKNYGPVRDLDWTFVESTFDQSSNAILSVGFARFVLLYTQLRYDYTNNIPTFAVLKKIDISDYTSHLIGDLIWIDDGFLVIGCGNQFFIDDKWVKLGSSQSIDYLIKQLVVGYNSGSGSDNENYEISHLVKILNGPLPVYHPQFLIQALFMNQTKLVQDVIVTLFKALRKDEAIKWDLNINMEKEILSTKDNNGLAYSSMHQNTLGDVFENFTPTLLDLLIEKLTKTSLPLLTRHQQITLILVITILKKLYENNSMDENGARFLIGFKLFQSNLKQLKLTMRDINWALHSDNRELIYGYIEDQFQHRITWDIAKKVGIVYWINEREKLVQIVEKCARNDFSTNRDPSGLITLFFLSIRKKQILLGLWKTTTHPEKQKMLKFLNNDFSQPRWKSAALKNAFVLLGKHRYLDAACFFLLADKPKDCCITLANKIEDIELSLLIAKVYDNSSESLVNIIENNVLPTTLKEGNRWITSWIFWELNLKQLSMQALIKSPISIVNANKDKFSEDFYNNHLKNLILDSSSRLFLQDDPVLAILYNNLRRRKVNYLEGSFSISPAAEFEFVIKVASIYTRMGCDYLALLLVRDWEFKEYNDGKTKVADTKDDDNDIFKEFKPTLAPPQPTTFEEPDIMSSFDF